MLRFLSVVFLNGILLAQNTQIQTVGLQIIVVSSQTDAQAVLNRLQHGADFASMAKELSIDSIAADGGTWVRSIPPACGQKFVRLCEESHRGN